MKNILKTALLATLPMVAVQADTNLTPNDPTLKHFQKLHEQMNKIFDEFDQGFFNDAGIAPAFKSHFSNRLAFSPKTDFIDKGKNYELKVDLPGVDEKEIEVTVDNNLISIKAKSEQRKEEKKDDKVIHQERFIGVVQRTLSLPKDANPEKYTTNYKNGVLTVNIEKRN